MPEGSTGLPIAPHLGGYGVARRHHIHEGVDLYCPEGTPVTAVEDGKVVGIGPFTGERAGSPYWENTWYIAVEGASGVVVYGEINDPDDLVGWWAPCQLVKAGDQVGVVKRVLVKDKGRPMSMLHLELHTMGTTDFPEWIDTKPETSLDPTPYLLAITCDS